MPLKYAHGYSAALHQNKGTYLLSGHDEIGALVSAQRTEQRPQLPSNRGIARLVRLVHAPLVCTERSETSVCGGRKVGEGEGSDHGKVSFGTVV